MCYTFCPSSEDVSQVQDFERRVIFGDGHRSASAEAAQTFFDSSEGPFSKVFGVIHVYCRQESVAQPLGAFILVAHPEGWTETLNKNNNTVSGWGFERGFSRGIGTRGWLELKVRIFASPPPPEHLLPPTCDFLGVPTTPGHLLPASGMPALPSKMLTRQRGETAMPRCTEGIFTYSTCEK